MSPGTRTAPVKTFQFYAEDHDRFTVDRDIAKVRELNPARESFKKWLDLHKGDLFAVTK